LKQKLLKTNQTNQKKGQFCVVATALQVQDRKSLESYEYIIFTTTTVTFLIALVLILA